MGKSVSIYMNKAELQQLETLGQKLGLNQDTKTVKLALKRLEESANGHTSTEDTVEIPAEVTLRGFLTATINEEATESKAREKAAARERERKAISDRATKSTNRLVDTIFSGVLK